MKKTAISLSLLLILGTYACKEKTMADPQVLPENEEISLFDGTSFAGWKQYNTDTIGPKWTIADGSLIASKDGEINNTGFGHSLITEKEFGNFELTLDYSIAKGGNSGIMYHVIEDTAYAEDYSTGPEFQILDDAFSKSETLPIKMAGACYDMYIPSAEKKLNPAGEWNSIKLVYNNGHVEHWLNGLKVVEFEEGSDDYKSRFAVSKWKDSKVWGQSKTGRIGLQDHGDAIKFKNIKIKELK